MLARIAHAHSHFCFSARPKNSVSQPGEKLVTSRSLVQGLGTATGLPRNCYITVLLQKRFLRYLFKSMQFLLADGELVFLSFLFAFGPCQQLFCYVALLTKAFQAQEKDIKEWTVTQNHLWKFFGTQGKNSDRWMVSKVQASSQTLPMAKATAPTWHQFAKLKKVLMRVHKNDLPVEGCKVMP